MRTACLLVLAACGGATARSTTPAMTITPPAEPQEVAAEGPPPPPPASTGGDPCMGGEVTPETTGGPPDPGVIGVGQGGGNPCGGGVRRRGHGPVVHLPPGATVEGPLDKAIIRRYVKRNITKIQYCYESALLKQPGLAGTVTAKFVIGADGLVAKSEASGLAGVDACVADVIQRIEFPRPQGGTVNVVYPFTFSEASK